MITLYLDSQLYRFLKRADNSDEGDFPKKELFARLSQYLTEHKERFLIFYSFAHLLDLKQDKTNHKYDDLVYMEKWVDQNFLTHQSKAEHTDYFIASPSVAFEKNIDPDDSDWNFDLSTLFDFSQFENVSDDEKLQKLKAQAEIVKTMEFPSLEELPGYENTPPELQEMVEKFFPIVKGGQALEVMQGMLNTLLSFGKDKSVYKGFRDMISSAMTKDMPEPPSTEVGKFIFDVSKSSGSEEEKMALVRNGLLTVVNKILKDINIDIPTAFDLHYHSYIQLDLFGIEKEKNNKLKPASMLNDAHHSFYGGHCDIVVSDDLRFREKSKLLYSLFGLTTQILSVEEFIESKFWVEPSEILQKDDFFRKIILDLATAISQKNINQIPTLRYFDYFDLSLATQQDREAIIVLKNNAKTYSNWISNVLVEKVTNKLMHFFKEDMNVWGPYDRETDLEQIKQGDWRGRIWRHDNHEIILQNWNTGLFLIINLNYFKN